MSQSLAKLYVHIVFSTKNREPLLADGDIRAQIHAYLGSVLKEYESPALLVGGTADHSHALCLLSKTQTLAKVIGESKRSSSKWIKTKGNSFASFEWQAGYGAFSVSHSNAGRVQTTIANQAEHHRNISFQEEFLGFLKKHSVEYDERYLWN